MWYSLLYGTLPFYSSDEDTTVKLIRDAKVKFAKDIHVMPQTKEIILQMLDKDPEKRLDLMDFMGTDYFKMDEDTYKGVVSEFLSQFAPKEEKKDEPEIDTMNYSYRKSPRRSPSPRSKGKAKKKKDEEQYAIVLQKEKPK